MGKLANLAVSNYSLIQPYPVMSDIEAIEKKIVMEAAIANRKEAKMKRHRWREFINNKKRHKHKNKK